MTAQDEPGAPQYGGQPGQYGPQPGAVPPPGAPYPGQAGQYGGQPPGYGPPPGYGQQPGYAEAPGYGPPPPGPYDQQQQYGQARYGQPQYGQAQYAPGPYAPAGYAPGYAVPRNNTLALWSMILGIVQFLLGGPLLGIPSIILGVISLRQIRERMPAESGRGMAIAGIVCSAVGIVITIFVVIFFISVAHAVNQNNNLNSFSGG
jgi:hypothetical protein